MKNFLLRLEVRTARWLLKLLVKMRLVSSSLSRRIRLKQQNAETKSLKRHIKLKETVGILEELDETIFKGFCTYYGYCPDCTSWEFVAKKLGIENEQ